MAVIPTPFFTSVCGRGVNNSSTPVAAAGLTKMTITTGGTTFAQGITVDEANNRMTALEAGKYQIDAAALFADATYAVGNRAVMLLHKNGSFYSELDSYECEVAVTELVALNGSDVVDLGVGDFVEIFLSNDRAGGTNLNASTNRSRYSAHKIR